jgi:hypothetical protein
MRRMLRHWRYAMALAIVLGLSIVLLVAAYAGPLTRYGDIWVNLGASLIGVVVTVFAIEPVVRRAQQPEELVRSEFPYEAFLVGVESATYKVRVLGAWPYVMDQPWRRRFLAAVSGAAHRRVRIEILVLDPASKAAEQRADDLGGQFDVAGVIGDVLRAFEQLERQLAAADRDYLDVRVYATLPPARMYRYDGRVISSFFPMGNAVGGDVKHYETSAVSRLAQFVDEQFELLWQDPSTRCLDDYLRLQLSVRSEPPLPANYVTIDGDVYVESPELDGLTGPVPVEILTAAIGRVPGTPDGPHFHAVALAAADSRYAAVAVSFRKKYGPANRLSPAHGQVCELVPMPAPEPTG